MIKDKEAKIGDVVKVLKGKFAGKTGIVVGISVPSRYDIGDPYYEVDMNCEVPDKYKCRKTLITPNNVIGGVSANEFEVMFKAPTANKPTERIKTVLSDTYWEEYRAELVKELTLKLTDTNNIAIPSTADHITDFATRIVNNLKK